MKQISPLYPILILVLFALGVLLPELWGSSEAREAHVVQTILRDGEWILPDRNGIIPSKPPLLHWISAIVSESINLTPLYAVRLVSFVSFVVILLCWGGILKKISGSHCNTSISTQNWFWAMSLTSYGIFSMATDARVDTLFSAMIALAILQIFRDELSLSTWISRLLLGFFAGFSVLAKGPLGLVLIFSAVLVNAVINLRRGDLILQLSRTFRVALPSFILALLISIPWYLMALSIGGDGFFGKQVIFENFQRLTGGEGVNTQPWYFYLSPLFVDIAPWSLFIPFTLLRLKRDLTDRLKIDIGSYFGIIWGLLVIVLFSVASGKRSAYLLPILPAIITSLSFVLADIFSLGRCKALLNRGSAWIATLLYVIGLLLICTLELILNRSFSSLFELPFITEITQLKIRTIQFSTIFLLLLLYKTNLSSQQLRLARLTVITMGVVLLSLISSRLIKGEFKGFNLMAQYIAGQLGESSSLMVIKEQRDEYMDPVLFLLNRRVQVVEPGRLNYLTSDSATFPTHILVRKKEFSEYAEQLAKYKPQFNADILERHISNKELKDNFQLFLTCAASRSCTTYSSN